MAARIPSTKISGFRGLIVKRFSKKVIGQVPEPLGVYWQNPRVLRSYIAVSSRTRKWDSCNASLKSFAHMAVASLVGCSWCLDFGYFQAHNENLDLEKARQVPRWRESDVFTPLEREVLGYAEAMSETPPTVTDDMSARLLRQLGPAAMVELTAWIAQANNYARSNVAFGIESDGFASTCGLKPLTEPTAAPETPAAT